MHVLDFFIYLVSLFLLWKFLDVVFDKEYTEELGGFVGIGICIVYTIFYVSIFVWSDNNWADIFPRIWSFFVNIFTNLKL